MPKKVIKNKIKLTKVDTLSVKNPNAKLVVKKTVAAKPEPIKALPIVDGYQVVKVLDQDHSGHTQSHLLCEAVSEGNKVTIHVNRKLF